MNPVMNKRGDEIVEAAMVLPILILTILSMILLILYYYGCLESQLSLHQELLTAVEKSKAIAAIAHEDAGYSAKMGGLVDMVMGKEISGRMYILKQAEILRAGELIGLE